VRGSAGIAAAALACALPAAASAHGDLANPPGRTTVCHLLNRDAPPCAAAWKANPQALYDWMEVNLGDVAGRHRERIPDGHLCSAGREKYAAFDAPGAAWPATPIQPGKQTFAYNAVAPHATQYFKLYLTKEGWDDSQALRWDDLELIYDSGKRPAEAAPKFAVDVPARTGHQLLYLVWQRSDSPEAFYSCADVRFSGDGPTVDAGATTPDAGMSHGDHPMPMPAATKSRQGDLALKRTVTSDWGAGYCATVQVTNQAKRRLAWSATVAAPGKVSSLWDAAGAQHAGKLHVHGPAYAKTLPAGASTSFGWCADR
jgi:predicted carbohydrate-binding protein with CBM5 and CBM33 domain